MKGRTIACAGLLLLLGSALLLAQSRVRIVIVSFVSHRVQVRMPAENGVQPRWQRAVLSSPVTEGEAIRTRVNSEAEVQLECGSALRLAPESEMTMTQLRLRKDGVSTTTVTVERGEAFFSLRDQDSRDFHVLLPGGELSLPSGGARMRLEVPAGKAASVEVLGGHVQVSGAQAQSLLVSSHQRIELLPGGLHTLVALAPDSWQQWSKSRDDLFERALMASAPQPSSVFGAGASAANPASSIFAPPPPLPLLQNSGMAPPVVPAGAPNPFQKPLPKVPACARG